MLAARDSLRGDGRLVTLVAVSLLALALAVPLLAFAFAGEGDPVEAGSVSTEAGATLFVGREGCDDARAAAQVGDPETPWCSLARAAAEAPDGSTVVVKPGRYPRLELDGRAQRVARVTFRSQDPQARAELAGFAVSHVRGVRLSGLLVRGGGSIRSSEDVAVLDSGFAGAGMYIRQSRRVRIEGNRIREVRGVERALLAQGGPYAEAVGAARSAELENRDLVIRGNLFERIDHDAIAVYNSHRRVRIEGNVIRDVEQPANFKYHSDAMQIMGGDRVTIARNVIYRVTHGILVKDGAAARRTVVRDNLITGTNGAALQLFNAPDSVIESNTIWGTRHGTILADATNLPAHTTVRLRDNILDQLIVQARGSVRSARANVFGRGRPVGTVAYRGRPAFVDVRGGDFRLRSARPGASIPRGSELPGAQLRLP